MTHAHPSPAVLALLASGGKRSPRGAAATVLDLIREGQLGQEPDETDARGPGFLRISADSSPESDPAATPLRPYERQVLDLVQGLADERGRVPIAALRGGEDWGEFDSGHAWLGAFGDSVAGEARAAGWTDARFAGRRSVALVGSLLGLAFLAALGMALLGRPEWSFGAALMVALGAILLMGRLRTDSVTPAGRALVDEARRRVQPDDPQARPEAVALGLVDPGDLGLDFGRSSVGTAWSTAGGRQQEVTIDYPDPRWVLYPLLVGGVLFLMGFTWLFGGAASSLGVLGYLIGGAVFTAGSALLFRAARFGTTGTQTVEALVLRRRAEDTSSNSDEKPRWWVALDTPDERGRVVAWPCAPDHFAAAVPGSLVRAAVHPGRRRMVSLTVLQPVDPEKRDLIEVPIPIAGEIMTEAFSASGLQHAVDAVRPVDRDAGPEAFVDPDLVHRTLGLEVAAAASPPAVGPIRTFILQSTTKPRTSLHVQVASGLAARALRRSGASADGTGVLALGKGRAQVDLGDGRILQVVITGPGSPADRTAMSEQLLRAAVARPSR